MTLREQFEAVFLEGKVRENILVASQLQLGADGEYFNPNTRALYGFFSKGAASVSFEVKMPAPDDVGAFGGDRMVYDADEIEAAIEAAGGVCVHATTEPLFEPADIPPARKPEPGCDTCAGKGDGRGNECDDCWLWAEIPF